MKELFIGRDTANQRTDKYLKRYMPGMESGFLYKMFRKKNITLNGKKITGREILKEGDLIRIFFSDETIDKFRRNPSPGTAYPSIDKKRIVYEDQDVLLVNKEAGVLSQKSSDSDISLVELIIGYLSEKGEVTEESLHFFKPGICNRLDRNTSGLVIAAKNLPSARMVNKAIKDRCADKYYLALVKGFIFEKRNVSAYLTKNHADNTVTVTQKPAEGKKSERIETIYEPVERLTDNKYEYTLLKVKLVTGKTHQIRGHLAFEGHPLAGDQKYGNVKFNHWCREKYGLSHQFLHAYEMNFPEIPELPHGIGGKCFRAPLPEDLSSLISKLSKDIKENENTRTSKE